MPELMRESVGSAVDWRVARRWSQRGAKTQADASRDHCNAGRFASRLRSGQTAFPGGNQPGQCG